MHVRWHFSQSRWRSKSRRFSWAVFFLGGFAGATCAARVAKGVAAMASLENFVIYALALHRHPSFCARPRVNLGNP